MNIFVTMNNIKNAMTDDHRRCDGIFAVKEDFLFPAFEAASGMAMGTTQVISDEHIQTRVLMCAARDALAVKDVDDYSGNAEPCSLRCSNTT